MAVLMSRHFNNVMEIYIIEKYKEWFAKNGAAFDFDAVQKAYKNQK